MEKESYDESEGVRSPKRVLKFLSSHLVFVEICKKLTENIQKSVQHCFVLYCPLCCRVYDFVLNVDVDDVIFWKRSKSPRVICGASRGNNWRLRERFKQGFSKSQDTTMFETISVPLLTSIITPLSIIFCLLATAVIFLYWREKCEKGSDMSNSLLLIVSTSNLANSIVSALVIVSIFTHSNKGTFLPCVLFNINNFSRKVQLISVLLLSVLVTWRKLCPDHYISVRQCALKRISGLASFALFAYQIFVDMMICNKSAFCPKEIMENLLVPEAFLSEC